MCLLLTLNIFILWIYWIFFYCFYCGIVDFEQLNDSNDSNDIRKSTEVKEVIWVWKKRSFRIYEQVKTLLTSTPTQKTKVPIKEGSYYSSFPEDLFRLHKENFWEIWFFVCNPNNWTYSFSSIIAKKNCWTMAKKRF